MGSQFGMSTYLCEYKLSVKFFWPSLASLAIVLVLPASLGVWDAPVEAWPKPTIILKKKCKEENLRLHEAKTSHGTLGLTVRGLPVFALRASPRLFVVLP